MSERRCVQCGRGARYRAFDGESGGAEWTGGAYPSCRTPKLAVEGVEPQEGGAVQVGQPAGSDPQAALPSCDSPELAAIRADDAELGDDIAFDCEHLAEQQLCIQRRALLRMVDELRKELDEIYGQGECDDWTREANDLRRYRDRWKRIAKKLFDDCHDLALLHRQERDDLRVKLAETEQRGADYIRAIGKDCFAAIAELEAKLAEAEAGAEELADEFDRERKRAEAAEARIKQLETRGHVALDNTLAEEARAARPKNYRGP